MPQNLCEKSLATGKRCGKPASIAVIRSGQSVGVCADCALKEYLSENPVNARRDRIAGAGRAELER